MRGNKTFYRWLNRIFWAALTVTVGYSWYYLDTAIPDRISIVQDQKEQFSFPLPINTTLSSERDVYKRQLMWSTETCPCCGRAWASTAIPL